MSATAQLACVGQPLSWLTLERHALAELHGPAAAATTEHLAQCAACAAALGTIASDRRALPALPALPALDADVPAQTDDLARARARRRQLMIGAGVFVAAAAALLLVLRPKDAPTGELSASVRVKGAGLVNMTLVRERDGAVAFDPPDVRDSDRWKVQLTCAPGGGATVEVVVYQPGEPAAVALPAQPFACGNSIVVPGAFRITGGAATICARLASASLPPLPATPGGAMACRTIAP
jgi:anti-sigma-K factor RskA